MGQAQSDNSVLLDMLTKSAIDLQLFTGSNYWRFGDVLTPISQNGGFAVHLRQRPADQQPGATSPITARPRRPPRSLITPGTTETDGSTRGSDRRRFGWAITER